VPPIQWHYCRFDELTNAQLYQLLQLRAEIFVVEQACIYQDPDGYDQEAIHVLGLQDEELICYCRIIAPDVKYPDSSIGRIAVSAPKRKLGLGKVLIENAIAHCGQIYPGLGIRISAQQHLEAYYQQLGFTTESEPYLEDDIPHIEMLLERPGR